MSNNYYQILGVKESAEREEIKKTYRRLARQFHPDIVDTPEAEASFKEINRAYDILSDPLKRADYDANLHPQTEKQAKPAPPPGTEEAYAWQAPVQAEGSNLSRISATAVVFLIAASSIEFFLRWLFPNITLSGPLLYLPGLALGLIFGIMWGIDNNLDVSSHLGPGAGGRFYTFFRSLIFTLTITYFLSLIGAYLDIFLSDKILFWTPALGILGIIVGSTLGSSGETPLKLSTPEGRFELFYTLLRGLEVGAIAAIVGGMLGSILWRLGYPSSLIFWGIFFGLALGCMLGSINPTNLTAYASYVSASLKNVIIGILIIAALILGLAIGIVFAGSIKEVFGIIGESLTKIIS